MTSQSQVKNHLENYYLIEREFSLLKRRFEHFKNIINSDTIGYIQFVTATRWINIGHNAKTELQNICSLSNSNYSSNIISSAFKTFKKWLLEVRKVNNIPSINGEMLMKCWLNPDHPRNQIIISYSQIEGAFNMLYEPMIKVISKEKFPEKPNISLTFKLSPKQQKSLGDLHDKLYKEGFTNTPYKDFKAALTKGSKKINWVGIKASLGYFIDEFAKKANYEGSKWVIASNIFLHHNKEITSKIETNRKPTSEELKEKFKNIIKTIPIT